MTLKTRRRLWAGGLLLAGTLAVASGLFVRMRAVTHVQVLGARHAVAAELVRLSGVQPGDPLFGTDDARIEDRVARHPWVRRAVATRYPTGVVRIAVEERVPVALVLSASGRAKAYLDAAGHAMPAVRTHPYDLPLVHGRVLPENLTQPAPLQAVRDLAATLATLSPEADALVSDLTVGPRGDVTLRTVAAPGGQALTVRLGRGGYDAKLDALVRFWHTAVLTRPTRRYEMVDLRFAGQVVTREAADGEAFPDTTRARSPDAPDSLRTSSSSPLSITPP